MTEPEARDRVVAALERWRRERAWARRDPASLAIDAVEPIGPTQIVLESTYEVRGVRYRIEAAAVAPTERPQLPDPWSADLAHPADLPIGNESCVSLEGAVHMHCELCSSTGTLTCTDCNGTGMTQGGTHNYGCYRCGGQGQRRCDQCRGSGGVIGYPTIWSRLAFERRVHVLESGDLPDAVYLELQDAAGGERIHEHTAERIVDLNRGESYREAASSTDPVRRAAQKLAADPGVPDPERIRRQRLTLLRVPAWRVRLANGKTLCVFGDPPRVDPARALDSPAIRALRVLPYAVAALVIAAIAAYAVVAM